MSGIKINNCIKIFEPFSNVDFENLSKWGKSLFTDICLPFVNNEPRKDLFLLMFFTNPSSYLNSERPLEKIASLYPNIKEIEDPHNKIFLSSIFTSENLKLESDFLLTWFKHENRPNVKEPDSFLAENCALDRYVIFSFDGTSDLKPEFNIIYKNHGVYRTIDINPGYLYVCNMIVRLDNIDPELKKMTIYPSNFNENVNGKLILYNKNTFDHYTNYSDSYIYVFRDDNFPNEKRYFICVHPLFMNGVLFKRLACDIKMLDFDNQEKDAYMEKNDFLAGVNISMEITKGLSNRFVISLVHIPIYQKINPLIYGSIAILGCIELDISGNLITIRDSTSNLFQTNLEYPIGKNGENVVVKWKRDNYLFPKFGKEDKETIFISPPDIEFYYSNFRPSYFWLDNEYVSEDTYTVLSIDGNDLNRFVFYDY